jgi:DNA-binding response OmpR family regulator
MDKQISLLVIDDDRMVRQILERALPQRGFEVHTAEDGPTGITIAREQPVDVILLDWVMPGMDGLQVLNMLKHSEKTRRIPVFMLTARQDKGDISQAISQGSDDYIVKPFNTSDIDKTIKDKLKKLGKAAVGKKKTGLLSIFDRGS